VRSFFVLLAACWLIDESLLADGKLLAPFLADSKNFFVISSDFCHWGKRFSFTHYDRNCGAIWQSIKALDEQGMRTIESQDPTAFAEYQAKYSNTICGRHPIGVMLNMLAALRAAAGAQSASKYSVQFVHYAQSSQCKTESDSSVSCTCAAWFVRYCNLHHSCSNLLPCRRCCAAQRTGDLGCDGCCCVLC
jgi:AmmeMemoRadiSam system protein B